jgi:hypothetical protein
MRTAAACLAFTLFVLAACERSPGPPQVVATENYEKARAEYWLEARISSITWTADGVRITATTSLEFLPAGDKRASCGEAHTGESLTLTEGGAIVNGDQHGLQKFTIRKIQPDKVIVEYQSTSSRESSGQNQTTTGTMELAYRAAPTHSAR